MNTFLKGQNIFHFPGGSDDKESACSVIDLSSIHGLGRSPGEGNVNPLHIPAGESHGQRGLQSVGL